jgi:hypothetical protein
MKTHSKSKQTDSSSFQAKAQNQANEGSILQAYKKGTVQLAAEEEEPIQQKENKTGLPDNLKSGVENLSGHSLDDVKVHYGSSKPAELQAHAYAQGTDIHIAPGQEKHLPHEAWHVAQQKQGRVKPTRQLKGMTNINDDAGLEKEADVMGAKALQMKRWNKNCCQLTGKSLSGIYQLKNSRTPNWVKEYQNRPNIHGQGIANYITHVEQGEGGGGDQQGLHALAANGAAPAGKTIVERESVGHGTIGKILWYTTGNPGAQGTQANPISVKSSSIFPTRLAAAHANTTGYRAIMKAAAANDGFNEISRAIGLDGQVNHVAPTVYPVASPLRPSGTVFQVNGAGNHYEVI